MSRELSDHPKSSVLSDIPVTSAVFRQSDFHIQIISSHHASCHYCVFFAVDHSYKPSRMIKLDFRECYVQAERQC